MATLNPEYSKELSIYEQETLRKIETFRAARRNWLLTNASDNTTTKEKENLSKSNVCNAKFRLPYLRKLKPPLTSCSLYKSLRPLRYYTLKPRTSDSDDGERRHSQKRHVRKYELVTPTVVETSQEKADETKHEERDHYWKPKAGPCQDAINRLRAAHLQQGLIESCRCDDGREVTVVIKGICLCDKNSLNTIKLNKVCERFCKLGVSPNGLSMRKLQGEEEPEIELSKLQKEESKISIDKLPEEKPSDVEDSTKFNYRKSKTSFWTDENSEVATTSEGKSSKKVDFTEDDIKRKMEPRKLLNINGSDLTIYRKLPTSEETLENSPGPSRKAESVKQPDPIKEAAEQLDPVKKAAEQPDPVKEGVERPNPIKEAVSVEQIQLTKESNKPPHAEKFTSEPQGDVSNWSFKSLNLDKGDIGSIKKSSAVSDLTEPKNKPRDMENETNLVDSSEKILPQQPDKQKTHSLVKIDSEGTNTSRVTVLDEKFKNLKHSQSKSASTISLFKNYQQEASTLGLTKEQMEVLKKNEKIKATDKG